MFLNLLKVHVVSKTCKGIFLVLIFKLNKDPAIFLLHLPATGSLGSKELT